MSFYVSCWVFSQAYGSKPSDSHYIVNCSVIMFLSDMSGRSPLYRKYVGKYLVLVCCFYLCLSFNGSLNLSFSFHLYRAFVFFSSPIPKELVSHIKKDGTVLTRISALREVAVLSLELLFLD